MSGLRLELFVQDLLVSQDFYKRVLGFQQISEGPDGYTVLALDDIRIDLQPKSHIAEEHPLQYRRDQPVGLGIEIVLEVDDVDATFAAAQQSGWLMADLLQTQPWGARDFRLHDPDGRYIRVTSA